MEAKKIGLMKNERYQLNKKQRRTVSIAQAGAKLFSTKGYLETSMYDIAVAAGLSKGGIYHYFNSKVEILYFILAHYMDFVLEDLEQELKRIEGGFEKIRYIISRHIDLYTKNIYQARTLLHEKHNLPPKSFKVIAEKERNYYQIIASTLLDYLGPQIQKDKVTVITFALLGMCNWIYTWYDPKGYITPQEMSEIICTIFFRGVGTVS